jgi:hypothetical protein
MASRERSQGGPGRADALAVHVSCYAGGRGEEAPRSFSLGPVTVQVEEILDRWRGPRHRYFKVRSTAGEPFLLRHDEEADRWELTRRPGAGG